ncbi:MAG: hypothetical protein HY334_00485 [Armatimonadetes bacterium]|nr:hypothetical protein [Armatimonadota bacterium]
MTEGRRTDHEGTRAPEAPLDAATLRAVEAWHRAWSREWEKVRALDLRPEDLPAPLWCWPP